MLSRTHRLSGLEPIVDKVLEFDDLKNTLGNWCVSEQETLDQLPLLEVTEVKLQLQQQECHALLEGITVQSSPLERLQDIADQFLRDTEVWGWRGGMGGGEGRGGTIVVLIVVHFVPTACAEHCRSLCSHDQVQSSSPQ